MEPKQKQPNTHKCLSQSWTANRSSNGRLSCNSAVARQLTRYIVAVKMQSTRNFVVHWLGKTMN